MLLLKDFSFTSCVGGIALKTPKFFHLNSHLNSILVMID